VIASGAAVGPRPTSAKDQAYADNKAAAAWMDEVVAKSKRAPSGVLRLSRFVEAMWFLTAPIGWRPNPGKESLSKPFEVPEGFITDLASIPRIFWSVLPRDGEYAYAAILHDYLYWTQVRDRATSDSVLRATMVDFGVSPATVTAIYEAVRFGGGGPWNQNRHLYEMGERRFLKVYPNDPKVRWKDWKTRPDVFAPEPKHGLQSG
jgi:Protein of unknown function (DUF1353)